MCIYTNIYTDIYTNIKKEIITYPAQPLTYTSYAKFTRGLIKKGLSTVVVLDFTNAKFSKTGKSSRIYIASFSSMNQRQYIDFFKVHIIFISYPVYFCHNANQLVLVLPLNGCAWSWNHHSKQLLNSERAYQRRHTTGKHRTEKKLTNPTTFYLITLKRRLRGDHIPLSGNRNLYICSVFSSKSYFNFGCLFVCFLTQCQQYSLSPDWIFHFLWILNYD